MIKMYQVIEGVKGWHVARVSEVGKIVVDDRVFMGLEFKAEIIKFDFNTAAEAQELADDLNEEHGYEPTSND